MTLAMIPANAAQALLAYRATDAQGATPTDPQNGADFGAMVSNALQGAVATGQAADAQSLHAIAGGGDLTGVVTAVSRAELALQTTVAIRDRVLQAYQDIIKMPI